MIKSCEEEKKHACVLIKVNKNIAISIKIVSIRKKASLVINLKKVITNFSFFDRNIYISLRSLALRVIKCGRCQAINQIMCLLWNV